jgi:hypothetical protein
MGSENDGRKNIQRLNEQNTMPIRLISGRMNVFIIVCHVSKPNCASSSFTERSGAGVVTFVIGIKLKLKLKLIILRPNFLNFLVKIFYLLKQTAKDRWSTRAEQKNKN